VSLKKRTRGLVVRFQRSDDARIRNCASNCTLVTILLAIIVWGLPLAPSIILFGEVSERFSGSGEWIRACAMGIAISSCILLWGICLLLLSGTLQLLIHPRIEEEKSYPLASSMTIRWAISGLLHRLTSPILIHLVPSFIGNWYYRLCGCKVGYCAQSIAR